MAFGDVLARTAQGIIANEQSRLQLEQREKAQEAREKQAERSFTLRRQEVEARQGFLELQTKQLENKIDLENDPLALRKRQLDLDFVEERIKTMRAEREARGVPGQAAPSVTETIRLGQEHNRIASQAQTARTDLTIRNVLDGEPVAAGIDSDAVLEGLDGAGVRSWEGLNAAIEESQKGIRSLENARLPETIKTQRLNEALGKRDALIGTRAELRKVFDQPVTGAEFRQAAPDSFPPGFTDELFQNGSSVEAQKRSIWGDSLFSGQTTKFLDVAIKDLRGGSTETMRSFINMFPGQVLDSEGRISEQGVRLIGPYFNAEGVPVDTGKEFIRQFNQQ